MLSHLTGPTFIKVGQSLSIRTDLLRPAYIKGLTKLQDCVPSFDTSLAREIIERELGISADTVFLSGIGPDAKVVAAASLGQVYKAVLRSDFSEVKNNIISIRHLFFNFRKMHMISYFCFIISSILFLAGGINYYLII